MLKNASPFIKLNKVYRKHVIDRVFDTFINVEHLWQITHINDGLMLCSYSRNIKMPNKGWL